jgi:hypothetical protein
VSFLGRKLRDLAEKTAKIFYEGPHPPQRLTDAVRHFATIARSQTEWRQFAAIHACEAYKTGYVRGLECLERQLDGDPSILLEEIRHDWGFVSDDPLNPMN